MKSQQVLPIWDIFKGTWKKHTPNPRFAIYQSSPTPGQPSPSMVLDKETRLVWERAPDTTRMTWDAAIVYSYGKAVAGRKGWRLPSIEELLSLVDPTQSNPTLPAGHPFVNVQIDYYYWSSTLGMSSLPTYAWGYDFGNTNTSNVIKSTNAYAWLVRGGYGHDYPY